MMDSSDEDDQTDQRQVSSKEEKLKQIEDILESLENGILELYKSAGVSTVWKKFMLIRNVQTKKRIEFTQCSECKALLTFKENSGSTHLHRHKCRIDENAVEVGSKYRILPPETAGQIQDLLIRNIMKYCADELIIYEKICQSTNFVNFAQSFVSLSLKHGNVCLKDLFPSSNTMCREISKFKDRKQHELYQNFRKALNNSWCSASLCIQTFKGTVGKSEKKLLTMRVQFYANDLSGLINKLVFSAPFDPTNSGIFLASMVRRFKQFGGDEADLHRMKIVTPSDTIFLTALDSPFSRKKCIVNAIIDVLDEAFENNESGELNDFFVNCSKIVRYINDSDKYDFMLEAGNASWKGKVTMMESINNHYDKIVAISKDDVKFAFQFNKRKSEEFISLLAPFVEAVDDLSADTYTTANKIFVWWAVLNEHLQTFNDYSTELKEFMINARNGFRSAFSATMDDKINCFSDPRFKQLLMLTEAERAEVVTEVRNLLQNLLIENECPEPSTSTDVSKAKKSRLENFESHKPKDRPKHTVKLPNNEKGKSRLSKYEATKSKTEENDEVSVYLKLPLLNSTDFDTEFDIIKKFWRSKQKILPKLHNLAITRLHVPAYCGSIGQSIPLYEELKDDYINDLLFIKDNLKVNRTQFFFVPNLKSAGLALFAFDNRSMDARTHSNNTQD